MLGVKWQLNFGFAIAKVSNNCGNPFKRKYGLFHRFTALLRFPKFFQSWSELKFRPLRFFLFAFSSTGRAHNLTRNDTPTFVIQS